jgi:hypothetical protein
VLLRLRGCLIGKISIFGNSGGLDDLIDYLDSKNAAPDDASCGIAMRTGWLRRTISV